MQDITVVLKNYLYKLFPLLAEDRFFNLKIAELFLALFFLFLIPFSNLFIKKYLAKFLKGRLYKNRRTLLYRLLYFRVDKLLRPLRILLSFYLLQNIYELFAKENSLLILWYSLYIILFSWFLYEIYKFYLYYSLTLKLKKNQVARRELFTLFLNIAKVFIVLVDVLLILSKMGIDITALITSLGVGGLIIGFSSKDTLTNFFDSIRLISEDAFRQGDWIETKDIEGFVTEIGLVSTKVRTFDNAMVTIPNSLLANSYVKNWTKRVIGRRIKFSIKVKMTSNTKELDRVVYEIYEMLHSHPDIVNENKLRYLLRLKKTYEDGLFNIEDMYGVRKTLLVYVDEIGEYWLSILIYAFSISVDWKEWLSVKQDIIKRIITIIDESELEFATPKEEIMLIER
jgi:MscS family membrane protein